MRAMARSSDASSSLLSPEPQINEGTLWNLRKEGSASGSKDLTGVGYVEVPRSPIDSATAGMSVAYMYIFMSSGFMEMN